MDMMSEHCINLLQFNYAMTQNKRVETMYEGSLEYMHYKKSEREWIENNNWCDNCVNKYKMIIARFCKDQFKPIKLPKQ